MDNEMADLFEDEKKKMSREEKKLEKIRKKQAKLDDKKKETDKILNNEVRYKKVEFDNRPKEIKEKVQDERPKREFKSPVKEQTSIIDFLYDTLFGFVTILLFLTSIGYLVYNYYKNNTLNNLVLGILLVSTGLFYMLTMFTKEEKLKKIFGIFASLSLMGFMAFQLFII